MDRQVISQRITSILGDISRLQSALYAMNTTDIQRYPDNYEVLSTTRPSAVKVLPAVCGI